MKFEPARSPVILLPFFQGADLFGRLCTAGTRDLDLMLPTDLRHAEELVARTGAQVGLVSMSPDVPESYDDDLEFFLSKWNAMEWIAVLAPGALSQARITSLVAAFCADFLYLPVTDEALIAAIEDARQAARHQILKAHRCFEARPIIGLSPVMRHLAQSFAKIAPVDAPVLVTGESGTGKELVARAIHYYSPRAHQPFVSVDCGAMPDSLVQSKLFGHEKGAFTGAVERKVGLIEAANGGTIFLDKIENLSLGQQVNLLRFLQESTIEPVGSNRLLPVDVRVIAAAQLDLEEAVRQGRLREDLYYRLNVLRVPLPALRERGKDIELLSYYFLHQFRVQQADIAQGFSEAALEAMYAHTWPGNVRELVNRVRRAAVMCDSPMLSLEDLGFGAAARTGQPIMTLTEARAKAEREVVLQSLKCTGYNITQSARLLNISRLSLYRLMDKYALVRKEIS